MTVVAAQITGGQEGFWRPEDPDWHWLGKGGNTQVGTGFPGILNVPLTC